MSEIEELLNSDKLSADKISHALSEIGYGNMLNGAKKMYDAGNAEGLAKGRRQGALAVIAGSAIIVFVVIPTVHWAKRKHEEKKKEIERIQSILEQECDSNERIIK